MVTLITLPEDVREWITDMVSNAQEAAADPAGFEAAMLRLVGAHPQTTELPLLTHSLSVTPDGKGTPQLVFEGRPADVALHVSVVADDTTLEKESRELGEELAAALPVLTGCQSAGDPQVFYIRPLEAA